MNHLHHTEKNNNSHPSTGHSKNGHVLGITGTIVDVQFPYDATPNILNELHILFPHASSPSAFDSLQDNLSRGPHEVSTEWGQTSRGQKKASIEVAQQLGDGVVRCIAIENIFNITRGLEVIDTGAPISIPVGPQVLGRVFNVLGDPIDGKPAITGEKKWSIFRPAPMFTSLKVKNEIQETGIKVIDIMCPYIKGSKIGLFGGAGVGKTVLGARTYSQYCNRTWRCFSVYWYR